MAFKPDRPKAQMEKPPVQTKKQCEASEKEAKHNREIGLPALATTVAAALAASPYVSEELIPHKKGDPSFQDFVLNQLSQGPSVQHENESQLEKEGIKMSRTKDGAVVVTISKAQPPKSTQESLPTSDRAIQTIEPTDTNPYTTLVLDTKELNKHFDDSKALGGLLKAWLGSEPIDNERQITPAALIRKMLETASEKNPALQRVLSETFLSDSMVKHFNEEMQTTPSLTPLLTAALATKHAPTMAAAWYEMKLRHSHVEDGGGRGGGINRTSLSELNTEYNSFRSLTYPNSPEAKAAIQKRFKLDETQYKVFLEYIDAMSYDVFGALPYTEMIPGSDWDANREVMEVILDKLGGNFAALMPTFAGTKTNPSSALGIHQNTESNAIAQASFFWPLVYTSQNTPSSHADVFLNHSNPLHTEMAIAYFDKWFHIIDFIKQVGPENARILTNPSYSKEFAQFIAGLHYQPTTTKESADAWVEYVKSAQDKGEQPSRSFLSFVPRAGNGQNAGPVDDLHVYMERNANHAVALASKLQATTVTQHASGQEEP
jgi:hypothetical protein